MAKAKVRYVCNGSAEREALLASRGISVPRPVGTMGEQLLKVAQALPSPPKKGPGRPRKDVQPLTRQQLRYRERMLVKAQEALDKEAARGVAQSASKSSEVVQVAAEVWSEVTDGQGVVLVDGKPVDPKGGA